MQLNPKIYSSRVSTMKETIVIVVFCVFGAIAIEENDRNSPPLNDEEFAKNISSKDEGEGLAEEFNTSEMKADGTPDNDFKMPNEMDDMEDDHDWSRWPFTDVDSPFAEPGFPFNEKLEEEEEDEKEEGDYLKHLERMKRDSLDDPTLSGPSMEDMEEDMKMKDEDFLRERERYLDDR